jgi:cyclic pyranopterin monophosphate synthase
VVASRCPPRSWRSCAARACQRATPSASHPIAISGVEVDLHVADDAVEITASVRTTDRTGVEMEALTSVTVAALTVVDMVKAVDKRARITDVEVVAKAGGRSGDWDVR